MLKDLNLRHVNSAVSMFEAQNLSCLSSMTRDELKVSPFYTFIVNYGFTGIRSTFNSILILVCELYDSFLFIL